jgi:hypothetical protein
MSLLRLLFLAIVPNLDTVSKAKIVSCCCGYYVAPSSYDLASPTVSLSTAGDRNCQFGVISNGIISIQNSIKIRPEVLDLKYAGPTRQTDVTSPRCSILVHILQTRNNNNNNNNKRKNIYQAAF